MVPVLFGSDFGEIYLQRGLKARASHLSFNIFLTKGAYARCDVFYYGHCTAYCPLRPKSEDLSYRGEAARMLKGNPNLKLIRQLRGSDLRPREDKY